MALFASYSENSKEASAEHPSEDSWLNNSSFNVNIARLEKVSAASIIQIHDANSGDEVNKRKKSSKSSKNEKRRKIKASRDDEFFTIDVSRNKEFLTVQKISRPSVPRYRVKYTITPYKRRHPHKFKRYFHSQFLSSGNSNSEDEEVITRENINTLVLKSSDNVSCFKHEEDLTKTTGCFNQSLNENPNDISMWLKYVHFQDTVYQFEKTYRKGSIAKGFRVTAERKLAILDKALTHNPQSEKLLRERLNIAVSVFPADELQVQLKSLVEKDPGNIVLWQGYIEATQCSMSHCSSGSVLSLYKHCLNTLHKLRRTSSKSSLEERILRMLYQCGLFLKQAGLFEQLWTLLQSYLELNLSPINSRMFDVSSGFDEKHLLELEEVVFKSQLPLPELWLRTEKLRESCHWLPISSDSESEDPQRMVFTEDVSELIHPITLAENTFKLVATILTLLKVPLLPCRHTTMSNLGLDYVPWSLDSIEFLLPMFLPLYHINSLELTLLEDNRLAVGPQYLKALPGQEEYLEFILKIMKKCSDCSENDDKIAVLIWWFRFQRLLIILDKNKKITLTEKLKKRMRSDMKNILKDTNKCNLQLYCEFALVEKEFTSVENAIKIISKILSVNQETSISANPNRNQIVICHSYRILIELMLCSENCSDADDKKALKCLVDFVTRKGFSNSQILTQGSINEAILIFKNVLLQLMTNMISVTPVQQFLPIFFIDWVICNGWLIYLHKGFVECGVFLEKVLQELDDMDDDSKSFHREILYEFYVAISYKHCLRNRGSGTFKILDDVLCRGIEEYPNNVFILSVLAKEQSLVTTLDPSWWKVKNMLLRLSRSFPTLFLVLISLQKVLSYARSMEDSTTGERGEMHSGLKNKILSLFQRITRPDYSTRRCGLIWRLYLQFVYEYCEPTVCRNVYYKAVEECPWLKALYIDAAIYIPAELSQIQDLIIEKQLRIHITPEELDILRS